MVNFETSLRGPQGQGFEPTIVVHDKNCYTLHKTTNLGGWGQGSLDKQNRKNFSIIDALMH